MMENCQVFKQSAQNFTVHNRVNRFNAILEVKLSMTAVTFCLVKSVFEIQHNIYKILKENTPVAERLTSEPVVVVSEPGQ